MKTETSDAMDRMLRRLDAQAKAAVERPAFDENGKWCGDGYSPELWIGTSGAHTPTCDALIRRGLADEGKSVHGFRTITINARGLALLGSDAAPAQAA